MKRIVKNCILLIIFAMVRPRPVARFLIKLGLIAAPTHDLLRPRTQSSPQAATIQTDAQQNQEAIVEAGPCKGMRYPFRGSYGSIFEGKLYGTYESELSPVFERLFEQKKYTQLIDIGAAEGYYAIGLAQRHPSLDVVTFDISPKAREMQKQIAAHNAVSDRITIGQYCAPKTLTVLPLHQPTLLICDCEGYEGILFADRSTAEQLKESDLIVELHTSPGINIRQQIEQVFAATHSISFVSAQTPIEKYLSCKEQLPQDLSHENVYKILNEKRKRSFGWLVMEANQNA
ncbi:hypothetical protein QEH52_13575 [Coraliomargarita sp. SDUM461003]|uniref:Methyltransferase small domain-containing protein n=1 Tax=Thalassobacterium maritimum TaxID=3041265 RepID=A0ABU1AWL3_9BACT|nr:hypothetical protein [Coraliomargarita sp. SDUM461003]MDQ8208549.1 hypothetical protein [Coraliomargarita sp. SDUM461003]